MGLDTTHDAWHGSYGGFSVWRRRVAVAAGIIEEGQQLYHYPYNTEADVPVDWEYWDTQTDYYGRWVKDPEDPIWILLAHSDCEGHIKKRFLLPLADRLEALAEQVDSQYPESWHNPTHRFVGGLRLAAEEGKKVKFH